MSNPNDESIAGEKRIEHVLREKERPLYISAFALFLVVFFIFYDLLVFIPFKIFADPGKKRERSRMRKAEPVDGNPSSGWRHVDTIGTALYTEVMGCSTLGKVWDKAAMKHNGLASMGTREVLEVSQEKQKDGRMYQKLVLGKYNWINYEAVDAMVGKVVRGLYSLGIKQREHVVIYSETRKEWMISAIACFKFGLPVVTVYATLGDEAVAFAMNECDGVLVFTSRGLLPKVLASIKNCPNIRSVVYFSELYALPEHSEEASEQIKQDFKKDGRSLYSFNALCELGASEKVVGDRERTIDPNDLAMIMYTSGTTGNPKGVLLSHRNIIAANAGQSSVIIVDHKDCYVGYLPLAHILEVCAELVCLARGVRIGYSSPNTLFEGATKIKEGTKADCTELEPTLIACVPAIMDQIFKAVSEDVKKQSPIQRELFRLCYARKRSRYEEGYTSLVMNRLAFDDVRKILGGRVRYVLSGGAPLNAETQRFMNICFCCPVVQGYGLTETCGAASLADENDLSTGSVGPPLRCSELKLREWAEAGYSPKNTPPQGEILIHGANVALGYYKNEQKTKEDFFQMADGKRWFASGDIGEFREDGSLCIIDRKKDLIKLSHGEYISLGKVETALLTNPHVENICVYGNTTRNYLIALVVPSRKNLKALAQKHNIVEPSWDALCANKDLAKLLQKELQNYASGKLRKDEMPKKVLICKEEWTPESDLLTEALKLKRKNIEKAFAEQIKQLYESM